MSDHPIRPDDLERPPLLSDNDFYAVLGAATAIGATHAQARMLMAWASDVRWDQAMLDNLKRGKVRLAGLSDVDGPVWGLTAAGKVEGERIAAEALARGGA